MDLEDPTQDASPSLKSCLLAEFLGTYLLVVTVGLNVVIGNPVWGVTSIACALMVGVYALGNVSGAHFNPAVTIAFALTGRLPSWLDASLYFLVQMSAGALAGMSYWAVSGGVFNLEPAKNYGWVECMVVEILYTCMLCFVVLSVACAKVTAYNQYYGLAIGFVIVAAGYAAGPISGAALNPAVAFGIDLSSAGIGFGWCFAYLAYEFAGAALAAFLFRLLYPEEWRGVQRNEYVKKFFSEFVGTFYLVLTVGLNVLNKSPATAWSIAACLMSMIYALASRSGAHLNPAVTLAIALSGRGKCSIKDVPVYVGAQILGGICAGFTYTALTWKAFALEPGAGYGWFQVCIAETVYTMLLCLVVLQVATVRDPSKDFFGLAIGMCVTVGGFAIGKISGGSLNPAVSIAIDTTNLAWHGSWSNCLWYTGFECMGGLLATAAFFGTRPTEYTKR